ncbi:MAG: tRNA uridine-5-carboxymethylaminomethyl(34) synthesis GTPase MnmE [Bacteroidaceae bacterium]
MKTTDNTTTICAIATASGGAIGIIRISGTNAIPIADTIFRGRHSLSEATPYSIHYGAIYDGQNMLDQVIVSVFKAPNSYTGENSVEISCHGSSYILQRILDLLLENGCTMASPGEFTMRAYINGKMDLSQAEAVADLISANNKSAHQIALNQMKGGISNKLEDLRRQLVDLVSLLELELDFSEEDVEFADRKKLLSLANEIEHEIYTLSSSFAEGNAIKNGVPVAIIGAPNVGKSTLLNLLLNEDRAIVSEIQGTTRDLIEDTVTVDGILFRFIDTAGIRHTTDTIEKMGIERSLQAVSRAHIILLVTQPGVPFPDIKTEKEQKVIKILNKSDQFQAINGHGLPWLRQQLVKAVPHVDNTTVLLTNQRHKQALDNAHTAISRAIDSLNINLSGDIVAEDLKQCLYFLSDIIGQVTSDTILYNIFKNFCIGK